MTHLPTLKQNHIPVQALLRNASTARKVQIFWKGSTKSKLPYIHEVKNRLNFGNFCCNSVKNLLKTAVFWIVVQCSLLEVYRRFRGASCLHHHGHESLMMKPISTSETSIHYYQITRHCRPKTAIFILAALRTSNLTLSQLVKKLPTPLLEHDCVLQCWHYPAIGPYFEPLISSLQIFKLNFTYISHLACFAQPIFDIISKIMFGEQHANKQ
jgi:hypothetical protein